MALTQVTEHGLLQLAKAKFGRESRNSVVVNFYGVCTYIHIKNSKTNKSISLGIDKFEEASEILMDSLQKVDERFRKEVSTFSLLYPLFD